MSIPNSSLPNVQMSASNSSLKVIAEGNGTIQVNSLAGGFFAGGISPPIPHNARTDNLIWQVATFASVEGDGNNIPTPYESNDDRALIHSYVDETNLYVEAAYQSSTGDLASFSIDFFYRVLLP